MVWETIKFDYDAKTQFSPYWDMIRLKTKENLGTCEYKFMTIFQK